MADIQLDGPAGLALRFVKMAPLHMTMLDLEGRLIEASQPFLDTFIRGFGLALDNIKGHPAFTFNAVRGAKVKAAFDRLAGGESQVEVEWTIPTPEGRDRILRSQASYCLDRSGRPVAVLFFHTDVTAELEAEAARRRTEAHLRAVVENIPAELLLLNIDKKIVELANPAFNENWAHQIESAERVVAGENYADSIEAKFQILLEDAIKHAEAADGEVNWEQMVDSENGRALHLRVKHLIFRNEDGDRLLLRIGEDVTELRESAEALKLALAQAEAANRAKSEFLANMSHEIRTPLNGVMGVAGALARTPLSSAQQEMVSIIETSAKTLETLLSDILDLARVEAGKLAIRSEPFDLAVSVNACAALFDAAAQAKGLDLDVVIAQDARGGHVGDAQRIRQILANLLGNAVKFTEKGRIALSVGARRGETSSELRFEVRDTGIGFDAEAKARLFSRFEQADGSITRRFGGSGLGLSISRALAEAMGGRLEVEARPGKGAAFSLVIELQRCNGDLELLSDEAEDNAKPDPLAGLRVLLAEDHPTNRRVVELILGAAGVELTCVANGAEAVEMRRWRPFDLVLMDMQMPVMDGLSAVAEIRRLETGMGRARTPILMLSANAMPEHIGASLAAGADGHISKPIMAGDLIERISEAALGRLQDRAKAG
jgi:signal transduction histidine kinase/ActR/RegA family two-component response regulator